MKLIKLCLQNMWHKPLHLFLSLVLFSLGVALVSLLSVLNKQITEKFEKNLAGIDLIIGAKGSPLQLVLNGLYHLDAPTGNIPLKDVKAFMNPKHPLIKKAIPLSLGDSYQGFRIVGTNMDFPELYQAKLKEGSWWSAPMEVVLGSSIAAKSKLKNGDTFVSSHGITTDDFNKHDHAPYKIVGLLVETGTVIDQLIITSPESIWEVHEHVNEQKSDTAHDEANNHEAGEDHHTEDSALIADREITTLLIQYKGRNIQTLNLQRNINQNTQLQAATPAIEINRLYSLMGIGFDGLKLLAWIISLVSGLSIFISLYNSLKERKQELALMRVMGARPFTLFLLIILEGLLIAWIGYIIGIFISHWVLYISSDYLFETYKYRISASQFIREEFLLLLASLAIGFFAAIIPAVQAYRTDIAETLGRD